MDQTIIPKTVVLPNDLYHRILDFIKDHSSLLNLATSSRKFRFEAIEWIKGKRGPLKPFITPVVNLLTPEHRAWRYYTSFIGGVQLPWTKEVDEETLEAQTENQREILSLVLDDTPMLISVETIARKIIDVLVGVPVDVIGTKTRLSTIEKQVKETISEIPNVFSNVFQVAEIRQKVARASGSGKLVSIVKELVNAKDLEGAIQLAYSIPGERSRMQAFQYLALTFADKGSYERAIEFALEARELNDDKTLEYISILAAWNGDYSNSNSR